MARCLFGDIGYVFRKEFGSQGWFTGTVVKIMKDGDRRCKYSDGDVEDLLLDDLVQLARLDTNSNSTEENKSIAEKSDPNVKPPITTNIKRMKCSVEGRNNNVVKGGLCITHGAERKRCSHDGCTSYARKGGVCITHGAKVKQCSFEDCTKGVIRGEFVGRMELRHGNDAAWRDVPMEFLRGEFVLRTAL